jgi:tripartite-type tricarboxylate transporter receptor subunit TctC
MRRRDLLRAASAGALLAAGWGDIEARAQGAAAPWPTKPIRIVVPFTPGGTSDILARSIGQRLTDLLGQPVIVENKPGGGANIGADAVAKSPPDGYALLLISTIHAINASLYSKLAYDPVRDLVPITLIASTSQVLVVDPALPVKTVADLVAYAKAKPDELNYSSPGSGSQPHLSAVLFSSLTGARMTHVPYKGATEAMTALLGHQVQLTFATAPSAVPYVKSGQMRALAVTTPARIGAIPDVPTGAEAGVPGFEVAGWNGLAGPAGLPAPIVAKLNEAVARVVAEPAMRQSLIELGADPETTTPEAFGAYIRAEVEKWRKVVKESGAEVD